MAKFTGSNMTASFAGVPVGCLTGVETNEAADIYTASCAGASYKVRAVGLTDASFTLTFLLDTATQAAELAGFAAGASGAFTCSANGTWGPDYSAAAAYIESLNVSLPVEGFVTATMVVGVDGALVTS